MCFSATANFVGSGALGAAGTVTLSRVKHRRELLFASLPLLFAIHQFIERIQHECGPHAVRHRGRESAIQA